MNYVRKLEQYFENYHHQSYESAIAVNSGTSGLFTSLKSCLDNTEKKEVITTPFTFQATSDAIVLAGGIPVFADIDKNTNLISIDSILDKFNPKKTACILPVHLFGRVFNTSRLINIIINTFGSINLPIIIEDACQSVLHPYLKHFNGNILCYSFNSSKNLQCGEGGMIIVKDYFGIMADNIRALTNNGRINGDFKCIGYNFRMSEHQALIAYNQIKYQYEQIISGLGKRSEKDGFYKRLTYHHPEYERLGFVGDCPVAEKVAKSISEGKYEHIC